MKKKWMIYIVIMTLIVIIIGMVYQSQVHPRCHGQFVIHCFDDAGKPMHGVCVNAQGTYHYGRGYNLSIFKGYADENGNVFVEFSRRADNKDLYLNVISKPSGFYATKVPILFERNGKQWVPKRAEYNFYFRKIVEPVSMYAKKVEVILPALDIPVGYDLLVGDWVRPHGKGMVSDLLIFLKKSWKSADDYTTELTITFPNHEDGVAPIKMRGNEYEDASGNRLPLSEMLGPWQAAMDGYVGKMTRRKVVLGKKIINEIIPEKDSCLSLRIRTEYDEVGKIRGGMYGEFGSVDLYDLDSPTARLVFSYKVNPNGSRIIEFHSSKNLFKDLKPEEQYDKYSDGIIAGEFPALRKMPKMPKQKKQPFAD
jgi:hypothetical protein